MPLPLAPQPPPALSASFAWLTASDPGFHRARRGGQAALSAALTGLAIWLIGRFTGLPVKSMGVGVMTAIFGVMMVSDDRRRDQHVTTAVLLVAAAVSATLASALAQAQILQALVFVPVVFAAVYARRYGPRWAGCGMVGFVTYLSACLLQIPFRQAPDEWLGVAIGLAAADLARTVLLKETPARTLRRIAHAMEVQAALVLDEIAAAIKAGAWSGRRRRRVRRGLNLVVQDLTLVENELRILAKGQADRVGWQLRERAFRLELQLWRIVQAALAARPAEMQAPGVLAELGRVRDGLRGKDATVEAAEPGAGGPGPLMAALQAFDHRASLPASAPIPSDLTGPEPTEATDGAAPQPGGKPPGARQALEAAVQSAAACALAIAGGYLVSPRRWIWAVISAFVVFAGVRSSGHVLVKSLQRIAGTLAGVAAGVALATALSGAPAASLPVLAVLVFLTFYSFQASYTAMILWLTMALALLYGLMGQFSPELLESRLKETLVGSAAGVLVAYTLFRKRTGEPLWQATGGFLDALGKVLDAVVDRAPAEARLRSLRDLTVALEAVRDTTRPNSGAYGPPGGKGSEALLLALMTARHYAMELALGPNGTGEGVRSSLGPLVGTLERLRNRLKARPPALQRPDKEVGAELMNGAADGGSVDGLQACLKVLEGLVAA